MAKKKSKPDSQNVVQNKAARFRYEILERMECGMALKGTEVKSLRNRQASLEEAFARIQGEELWLFGCHINLYSQGNVQNHEPTRPRKLLAHKREIRKWIPQVKAKGLTIVPLDIHFNTRGLAKITLALVRGKTFADKRQDIRKREHQREMERAMRR
ncbi:MAG: SsrA-binding protein SmpB [Planctomycetes bacterium]|nr:SsrA-binding protein SmpB [Planctomycetota bacterium]